MKTVVVEDRLGRNGGVRLQAGKHSSDAVKRQVALEYYTWGRGSCKGLCNYVVSECMRIPAATVFLAF